MVRLGLTEGTFGEMRPSVYFEAMQVWHEDKEADRVHDAELIRGLAVRLINIQLSPEHRYTDVSKFWNMPWDEDNTRAVLLEDKDMRVSQEEFIKKIGW